MSPPPALELRCPKHLKDNVSHYKLECMICPQIYLSSLSPARPRCRAFSKGPTQSLPGTWTPSSSSSTPNKSSCPDKYAFQMAPCSLPYSRHHHLSPELPVPSSLGILGLSTSHSHRILFRTRESDPSTFHTTHPSFKPLASPFCVLRVKSQLFTGHSEPSGMCYTLECPKTSESSLTLFSLPGVLFVQLENSCSFLKTHFR